MLLFHLASLLRALLRAIEPSVKTRTTDGLCFEKMDRSRSDLCRNPRCLTGVQCAQSHQSRESVHTPMSPDPTNQTTLQTTTTMGETQHLLVAASGTTAVTTLFVILISSVVLIYYYYATKTKGPKKTTNNKHQDPPRPHNISPAIWHSFLTTAAKVRKNNSNLSIPQKLALYGLYKQVVVGDAPQQRMLSPKFFAWNQHRGMSTETAIGMYLVVASTAASGGSGNIGGPKVMSRPLPMTDPMLAGDQQTSKADDDDATFLHRQLLNAASTVGNVQRIEQILQKMHHLNDDNTILHTPDPITGETALHLAANAGCLVTVQTLVENLSCLVGTVVTVPDAMSVLQIAVVAGHVEVCRWLLYTAGADPDQPDADGDTPRSCAIESSSPEMRDLFAGV